MQGLDGLGEGARRQVGAGRFGAHEVRRLAADPGPPGRGGASRAGRAAHPRAPRAPTEATMAQATTMPYLTARLASWGCRLTPGARAVNELAQMLAGARRGEVSASTSWARLLYGRRAAATA